MKQTDLTLQEILSQLESGNRTYPTCLLLNEVGAICTEEKNEEAEKFLLSSLGSDQPGFRAISFCWLYCNEELRAKHHLVLAEFRTKPENQTLNEDIDIMILKFQRQMA